MDGAGTGKRRRSAGQSLVEFALTIPILFLITVAVGDFGRVYASWLVVESATREAADWGAWDRANWYANGAPDPYVNVPLTLAEMERRACTAASTLPDYEEPDGTINHETCTNPQFLFDCPDLPNGNCPDLEDAPNEYPYQPGCALASSACVKIVHVTLRSQFSTIIDFPPLPSSVTLETHSRFAISPYGS